VRIVHAVHRYPPAIGGAEAWCAGLARWQAAHGHAVNVITLRAVYDHELFEDRVVPPGSVAVGATDDDAGVAVHRCRLGRVHFSAAQVLLRSGLAALTRPHSSELYGTLLRAARAADLVHAHAIPHPHVLAAYVAARLARRPFVLTPHFHPGDPWHEARPTPWLLRHSHRVLADTEAEVDVLCARGVRRDRIRVVSTGIDPAAAAAPPHAWARVRQRLGVPTDAPLLCYVGRKGPTKGLDVLLRALPRVRHQPTPRLVVAGPSSAWFEALPQPPGTICLPALSESAKIELLAAADLLVLPSRNEAFGIVFLEAWAAGTAVLGSDVPTVREVLGDAGATFRADDADDLAARIDSALADPARARLQVARGRDRITAHHTWDRVGTTVMAAYAELVPPGALPSGGLARREALT